MALVQTEGFGLSTSLSDFFTYGVFTIGGASASSIKTGGPSGDNYLDIASNAVSQTIGRSLPASYSAFFSGQRMADIDASNRNTFQIQFLDANSSTAQVTLAMNTSGTNTVTAYRGSTSGTVLGTSATGVVPSTGWFYVDCGIVISPTAGSVEVKINGTVVLNLTGQNTQNVSSGTVGTIAWFAQYQLGVTHCYITDTTGSWPWNGFLGEVRVATLRPTANDAVQFTPVGQASNYLNAAEYPPVPGTDYHQTATVGDQDTFTQSGVPAGYAYVVALNVKSLCKQTVPLAGANVSQVAKSSGVTGLSTTSRVISGPFLLDGIFETDPNTGSPWAVAAASAATFGYKLAS